MFGLGLPELVVILVIALLLFGAKRLPEIARGLGKSIGLFKKALKESEFSSSSEEEKEQPPEIPKQRQYRPKRSRSSSQKQR